MPKTYIDKRGRELFVSYGLGSSSFGTFWRAKSGGMHRVVSKFMPMTQSQDEAQTNLDAWAAKKGLQPVEASE